MSVWDLCTCLSFMKTSGPRLVGFIFSLFPVFRSSGNQPLGI